MGTEIAERDKKKGIKSNKEINVSTFTGEDILLSALENMNCAIAYRNGVDPKAKEYRGAIRLVGSTIESVMRIFKLAVELNIVSKKSMVESEIVMKVFVDDKIGD